MEQNLDPYGQHDPETMRSIWEPRKEYIEKDLWIIKNFLSEDELSFLDELTKDEDAWYSTMRSPYGGNTRNKFIAYIPEYMEDGNLLLPSDNSKFDETSRWHDFFVHDRLYSVMPETYANDATIQSFFEVPDEQIIEELGHDVDFAMNFHYERDVELGGTGLPTDSDGKPVLTGVFSIYINDDFDGGELMFKHKDYIVKPERGMLVNVPLYGEFEHAVAKVRNGDRHTLYGHSWLDNSQRAISTNFNC